MKKSLFALAVLGAFAGAASAQTSVTVYGVADLSLAKQSGASAQMSGSGGLNNGTSRLGFRGTEDLGGGLKASFNFEQGLNLENGAQTAGGNRLFDRAANMALSGNWGTLSMGRMLTTQFFSIAAWELTGTANYSIVGRATGAWGVGGPRNDSEFRYTSPNFNGFSVAVSHVLEDDGVNSAAGANTSAGGSETSLNVIYKGGPIAAGFGYNKADNADRDIILGGAYNFGAFKIAGSYFDPTGVSKGFSLGGGTTMGPVSLVLDVVRQTGTGIKHTDYLIEAKYNLSKRTNVYAVYLNEGEAANAMDGSNFAVGVRHNF